jgi:hypothetical protein
VFELNDKGEVNIKEYTTPENREVFTREELSEAYVLASYDHVKAINPSAAEVLMQYRQKKAENGYQVFNLDRVNLTKASLSNSEAETGQVFSTENVSVYGKYKPVALKVKPIKTELPAEF